MTSDGIKSVEIIAITNDGKHIMAVSDEKPIRPVFHIWYVVEVTPSAKITGTAESA